MAETQSFIDKSIGELRRRLECASLFYTRCRQFTFWRWFKYGEIKERHGRNILRKFSFRKVRLIPYVFPQITRLRNSAFRNPQNTPPSLEKEIVFVLDYLVVPCKKWN